VRALPLGELIGRRDVLRTATAVLRRTARDRDRVGDWAGLVICGIGGIGKTAVAGRILARARENGWATVVHVGLWNPAALFEAVAAAAIDVRHAEITDALHSAEVDDAEKLDLVATMLAQARLVLLFDDFEQNLTTDARGFTDPVFADIFARLCTAADAGRVVVTCRYPVPDSEAVLLRVDLPALTRAELGRLFLRLPALRELPGTDRRLIWRTIGGHPRLIEFLDVLLRDGLGARLRSVTAKLRALAERAQVDLRPGRPLTEAVTDTLRLGSLDILLDALIAQLSPNQYELLLQAALPRTPFTVDDLAHTRHGLDPTPAQQDEVRRDVERLTDLTLLSPAPPGQLIIHPLVRNALEPRHDPTDRLRRHQRAALMRRRRLDTGPALFEDIVELVRHLSLSGDHAAAAEAIEMGHNTYPGDVLTAALLSETLQLIPPQHPRFLHLAQMQCTALSGLGLARYTASRWQQIAAIAHERSTTDPEDTELQRTLGGAYDQLGELARSDNDLAAAVRYFRQGLDLAIRLAVAKPENRELQRDLSIAHIKYGDLALDVHNHEAARSSYDAARTIRERLVDSGYKSPRCRQDLASALARLGTLAVATREPAQARALYQHAHLINEAVLAEDPTDATYRLNVALTHDQLGDIALSTGDPREAAHHLGQAHAIIVTLAEADPDNVERQRNLSTSHEKVGDAALATGDVATARHHFEDKLRISRKLIAVDAGNREYQEHLRISRDRLASLPA
jgi:tetratricopeptide (TPR) repeat protein